MNITVENDLTLCDPVKIHGEVILHKVFKWMQYKRRTFTSSNGNPCKNRYSTENFEFNIGVNRSLDIFKFAYLNIGSRMYDSM